MEGKRFPGRPGDRAPPPLSLEALGAFVAAPAPRGPRAARQLSRRARSARASRAGRFGSRIAVDRTTLLPRRSALERQMGQHGCPTVRTVAEILMPHKRIAWGGGNFL